MRDVAEVDGDRGGHLLEERRLSELEAVRGGHGRHKDVVGLTADDGSVVLSGIVK